MCTSKSQIHWEPQARSCLYSARLTKTRTAFLCITLHQNPSSGYLQAEPWSCWHLALLAVSCVMKSLLPLNPFPKHFSSKPCLTKTIPLQLGTAHCSQKQGSVNFKVFLWRRVLSNADVKGNRREGNMSSAPPPSLFMNATLKATHGLTPLGSGVPTGWGLCYSIVTPVTALWKAPDSFFITFNKLWAEDLKAHLQGERSWVGNPNAKTL